jgi:hypothetical protein
MIEEAVAKRVILNITFDDIPDITKKGLTVKEAFM